MTRQHVFVVIFAFAIAPLVSAQDRVTGANYPLAQKFNRGFVAQHVQEVNVSPQWIGKTDTFWYSARTATGTKYWKVDPAKKEKLPLFDHVTLAGELSVAAKKPIDSDTLRLDRPVVTADGKKLTFTFGTGRYEYELETAKLKALGQASAKETGPLSAEAIERMRQQLGDERVDEMLRRLRDGDQEQKKDDDQIEQKKDDQQDEQRKDETRKQPTVGGPNSYKNYAPDKKKYVYGYKHNLYLNEEGQPEDKATQLTTDGVEDYSFASSAAGRFSKGGGKGAESTTKSDAPAGDRKTRPNVTWSQDSKAFYTTRTDSRGVKELFLVDSIANPRPRLEQYKYPMPGEDTVRKPELYYCNIEKKSLTRLPPKWKDERYSDLRWGKSPGELRFIRRDRLQRNLEICSFDVFTEECKCLFGEAFDSAFLDMQMPRYIDATDEMIWWSERSGWGHFYRYGRDGTFKNAITSGAWRASRIVEVDTKAGYIYLIGNAREEGENPYFTHLYRVKFDGTELTCLDPSVGPDGKPMPGGYLQTSSLSPNKKFVVTNSTRVDAPPFASVRDITGKVLMVIEQTDLASLEATGWRLPETFSVKAADGVTDLYGNMWKPFDFNPKKKYPIIAYVYPGPQTEGVTYRFTAHSSYMQLSQLGFIVIQVGHRGGSPERSKAYHSFGYFNLRDYGLVDKKAAIEALAARHNFIDIDRVGIYGHSGGGFMSAAAVLQTPYNEFFKAAVASAGNHDNNIYNDNWSERYHGLKEVPLSEEKKDSSIDAKSGKGGGKGFGGGGRKKGPPLDDDLEARIEAEIEAEMMELIEAFDPEDQRGIEELEQQLAALREKLASLKKQETRLEIAQAPPPRSSGTAIPKNVAILPQIKFEIKVPTNAELASNLKGHLLLVHGEIDNNVHPANTMRLADALIKANKRFDLLIIPGCATWIWRSATLLHAANVGFLRRAPARRPPDRCRHQ
jgi:dipeptidyl-peptidase 4